MTVLEIKVVTVMTDLNHQDIRDLRNTATTSQAHLPTSISRTAMAEVISNLLTVVRHLVSMVARRLVSMVVVPLHIRRSRLTAVTINISKVRHKAHHSNPLMVSSTHHSSHHTANNIHHSLSSLPMAVVVEVASLALGITEDTRCRIHSLLDI
jgi:hypothetical protein